MNEFVECTMSAGGRTWGSWVSR